MNAAGLLELAALVESSTDYHQGYWNRCIAGHECRRIGADVQIYGQERFIAERSLDLPPAIAEKLFTFAVSLHWGEPYSDEALTLIVMKPDPEAGGCQTIHGPEGAAIAARYLRDLAAQALMEEATAPADSEPSRTESPPASTSAPRASVSTSAPVGACS